MTPTVVPFVDLGAQYASIRGEIRAAIDRVLESQAFILGSEVTEFEQELSAHVGVRHAIGVSSGTDALLAALMAIGVGPGDEVVTTPFTFVATSQVIARLGARAVLVDIEPSGFAIDAARIDAAITAKTKAIVPVHLFGELADMRAIQAVAAARGVPVVEDAAQAIGARRDGLRAGEAACLAAYSFFPTKNLGAYGDAGAVLTDDDALAQRVRRVRAQGQPRRHVATEVGGNFRLDALQAAILRVKLTHLAHWTAARRRVAESYVRLISELGLEAYLTAPTLRDGSVHHQFAVRTGPRDALRSHLADRGIGTEIYYPTPMHLQPCFSSWGYARGDFPHAERATQEVLALPIYPELTLAAQTEVACAIRDFFAAR